MSTDFFRCPHCRSDYGSKVRDSRMQKQHRRRRYECGRCGKGFTTTEVVTTNNSDTWIKVDGRGTTTIHSMADWLKRRIERAKIAIEDAFKGA